MKENKTQYYFDELEQLLTNERENFYKIKDLASRQDILILEEDELRVFLEERPMDIVEILKAFNAAVKKNYNEPVSLFDLVENLDYETRVVDEYILIQL